MAFSTLFSPRKLRSNDAIVGSANILTANPSTLNLPMLPTGTRYVSTLNGVAKRPQVPETQPILIKRQMNRQADPDPDQLKTGQSQQINTLTQKVSTLEEDLKCQT